jgi:RNA polymerase sigma factor (sigma-70 family)
MGDTTTTRKVDELIPRLLSADGEARKELVTLLYDRLHSLTRLLLRGYPGVRRFEQTTEVLHGALMNSLRRTLPPHFGSADHVVDWFGRVITRHLIDRLRHYYGPHGMGANLTDFPQWEDSDGLPRRDIEVADGTHDPARLAKYTEWFERFAALDGDEREVMTLSFYEEKGSQEIADILGVHRDTVRRRMRDARTKLGEAPWST